MKSTEIRYIIVLSSLFSMLFLLAIPKSLLI